MIANARHFGMQMKVVHSADENAQRANQLLCGELIFSKELS